MTRAIATLAHAATACSALACVAWILLIALSFRSPFAIPIAVGPHDLRVSVAVGRVTLDNQYAVAPAVAAAQHNAMMMLASRTQARELAKYIRNKPDWPDLATFDEAQDQLIAATREWKSRSLVPLPPPARSITVPRPAVATIALLLALPPTLAARHRRGKARLRPTRLP